MDLSKTTVAELTTLAYDRWPTFEYWSACVPHALIYGDALAWVIAYWIEGGSEGFFVHVDRLDRGENRRETLLFGKTFRLADAIAAATQLHALLQGVGEPELVPR